MKVNYNSLTTELRVGNLFELFRTNGSPDEWRICEIQPDHVCTCSSNPEWFRPIPLTPEWLEKFGAIYPHKDRRCQIGELCFFWSNKALFLNESGWNESITDYPIDQVHKLQNVYYSLTGQELELKP